MLEIRCEIRAAFDAVDVDHCGAVYFSDVVEALKALGLRARKSEVKSALRDLGGGGRSPRSGEQTIDFDCFSKLLEGFYGAREPVGAMLEAFALLDASSSGAVGAADLQRTAGELGLESMGFNAETDAERMVQMFASSTSGREDCVTVDEEDFAAVLAGTSIW